MSHPGYHHIPESPTSPLEVYPREVLPQPGETMQSGVVMEEPRVDRASEDRPFRGVISGNLFQEADTPEGGMSPERLDELIGRSIYAVNFRNLEGYYGMQSLRFTGRGQFPTGPRDDQLVLTGDVQEHTVRHYIGQGAAELVTYTPGIAPSGEVIMGVAEPLSLINYMTLRGSADGIRYPYPEFPGKKDSSRDARLGYGILLPASEAKELFEAMQANPDRARLAADKMITNPRVDRSKIQGEGPVSGRLSVRPTISGTLVIRLPADRIGWCSILSNTIGLLSRES